MTSSAQDTPKPRPTDTAADDWGDFWKGRTATDSGTALVGVERNTELTAFWSDVFRNLHQQTALLDLACGAGTVLRTAHGQGFADLTGLDISADALAAVTRDIPDVRTVVASADAPPFAPDSFDLVVSQFGVEYADIRSAASAIPPLLHAGGRIVWLTHLAGGAIAKEVALKAKAADTLLSSGFIPAARALFSKSEAELNAAISAFRAPQDIVLALAKAGDPLASHLYSGTQRMYQRRAAYAPADIGSWYDGTEAQIRAFSGRMNGMLSACVDDADAHSVETIWKSAGLSVTATKALSLGGRPAARVLRAQKSTQP